MSSVEALVMHLLTLVTVLWTSIVVEGHPLLCPSPLSLEDLSPILCGPSVVTKYSPHFPGYWKRHVISLEIF